MSNGRPHSIEVEKRGDHFVVATYAGGSVVRKLVYANERPKRKPRKPFGRKDWGAKHDQENRSDCPT
jgi:hypothetical protein